MVMGYRLLVIEAKAIVNSSKFKFIVRFEIPLAHCVRGGMVRTSV